MRVIASQNGLEATRRAFELLQSGVPAMDATVEGVTLVEDDPEELTVGYGGLPNELGQVELDAAVMDGPTHRGGAVAGLREIRHAARVARLVMRQTNRVLLAGEGARDFALSNGFPRENLLTDKARRMWLHWKRMRSTIDDWHNPHREETDEEILEYFDKHYGSTGGTVHCSALDADQNLGGTTSTSGHAFKLPGRIGDSPILGAGLYVDNQYGACGSVGHGEANLENLSSFLAVELMRQGAAPEEAGLQVLRRVAEHADDAICDDQGRPKLHLQLFLLHKDGRYCGVTMWGPKRLAVSDADGTRWEDSIALYERPDSPNPRS